MTGRGPRTRTHDNKRHGGGTAPTPTTAELKPWLTKELLTLADLDGDMYGKRVRAVKADQSVRDDLMSAPDGLRRMMRQLKSTVLGSPKSERDKAKDKAKAVTSSPKVSAKYTKLVGDDFTTATL